MGSSPTRGSSFFFEKGVCCVALPFLFDFAYLTLGGLPQHTLPAMAG